MQNNYYVCIMAGGSGTRLWPMSRSGMPKQFQKLCSEKSLIQETYDRIKDLVPKENIYISLVESILETSQKQLPEVPKENFIVEPEGKNTAPAIALVGATIFKRDPNAIVITLASDHVVDKLTNFKEGIKTAFHFVDKNPEYFTTVGIKPTRPDTGLGYIKVGRKFTDSKLHIVDQFVEKPDFNTAKKYVKSGAYLWNASYFVWRADNLLKIYETFAPDIYKNISKILPLIGKKKSKTEIDKIYREMPNVPVDTAIAEKVEKIAVLPVDLGWSDIGNWTTLYEFLSKKSKAPIVSRGNHISIDDKDCLIYAQDKLLATVGLQNIVVVDTPDVTLVCSIDRAQEVKKIIEEIKSQGKNHYL